MLDEGRSRPVRKWVLYGAFALIILIGGWFAYARYQSNVLREEEAIAEKAAAEAAQSENPFTETSPLSNVEVDPFEKTKKVLNPFEQ